MRDFYFISRRFSQNYEKRLLLRHIPPYAWYFAWNNVSPTRQIFMKFHIWVFSKICWENSTFITTWQEWRVLYSNTYVHLWQYIAQFFVELDMFQTNVVEKIKTHTICSITFFRKSCRLWDKVEKYGRPGQPTWQYNTAHALCLLEN